MIHVFSPHCTHVFYVFVNKQFIPTVFAYQYQPLNVEHTCPRVERARRSFQNTFLNSTPISRSSKHP